MTSTFDLKVDRGPPGVTLLKYMCEASSSYGKKEMELSSKNGKTNCKKFKVQIWSWFLTY